MNDNMKKLDKLLTTHHLKLPIKQAAENLPIEVGYLDTDTIIFYKYNWSYTWAYEENNEFRKWVDIGTTSTIEEQLNDDDVQYILDHPEFFEENDY